MAPTYGWTADSSSKTVIISSRDNNIAEDISNRLKKTFLLTLCKGSIQYIFLGKRLDLN